jgi:hypothetical protein
MKFNRAFHAFGKAKLGYGGLVLSSSQLAQLLQLPQKTTINKKFVKSKPKIKILLC